MLVFLALLTGCAGTQPPVEHGLVGVDGIACVGTVQTPPAGLVESAESELLARALGKSGAGKLCAGKVFQVISPVSVYRVWHSEKSYTLYGGWWSFTRPQGPQDRYREENAICPSWSALDRLSSCSIKAGAKIVVGPGQSADCQQDQLAYAKSPVNQVFIPNDARNDMLYVENCTAGSEWP